MDLLVACVWNKDIKYYANILESIMRDLHCYVIQANTSHLGDSLILQPKKTEEMTLLRVLGGDNDVVLTAELDIEKLRDFQLTQINATAGSNSEFKPLPPGFNPKNASPAV